MEEGRCRRSSWGRAARCASGSSISSWQGGSGHRVVAGGMEGRRRPCLGPGQSLGCAPDRWRSRHSRGSGRTSALQSPWRPRRRRPSLGDVSVPLGCLAAATGAAEADAHELRCRLPADPRRRSVSCPSQTPTGTASSTQLNQRGRHDRHETRPYVTTQPEARRAGRRAPDALSSERWGVHPMPGARGARRFAPPDHSSPEAGASRSGASDRPGVECIAGRKRGRR